MDDNNNKDTSASDTKKKRLVIGIILGVIVVPVIINLASSHDSKTSGGSTKTLHTVLYKLEGTASQADITISTATGGTSQQEGVDVPLKRKSGELGLQLNVPSGAFLYISAQNSNSDGATITCVIEEDGIEIARNTSRGDFAIADCSGTA